MKVYLASGSAARKRALDIIGVPFEVSPSRIDEESLSETDPASLVRELSLAKARAVGDKVGLGALVIGGDMFTVIDGQALQKPTDILQAKAMIRSVSGKTFEVFGGVAVYNTDTNINLARVSRCSVTFRQLTDAEIDSYVSRWPVLDYAAGFNDEAVIWFAQKTEGAYSLATGFSVDDLVLLLREQGYDI